MSWKYTTRGFVALVVFTAGLHAVEQSISTFAAGDALRGTFYAAFAFALIVQALFVCVEGVE
jgi:hypothetical protein